MRETEFTRIVEQYQKQLFVIAFHVCRNRCDAEDAVQETFLKLYTKNPAFQSEEHLRSWLIRVTIQRCRDLVRSPFRSHLPLMEADAILTCCDMRRSSSNKTALASPVLRAAVYAAFGAFAPTGTLPVDVPALDASYRYTNELLYPRGHGLTY